MTSDAPPTIEHAKVRLFAGPLTQDEDPELWEKLVSGHEHLKRWFGDIGVDLVVHADYRIALLRQMNETERQNSAACNGRAILPPLLQSRALTFFESQVLSFLHDKLNAAVSMGNHDLVLLRSEIHDAVINLQPAAQRNKEATQSKKVDSALKKFREFGLLEEAQIGSRPAIRPNQVLLLMVSRDELERFSQMLRDLVADSPSVDGDLEDRRGGAVEPAAPVNEALSSRDEVL